MTAQMLNAVLLGVTSDWFDGYKYRQRAEQELRPKKYLDRRGYKRT